MSECRLFSVLVAVHLFILPGCTVETKSSSPFMPVSGKITYKGSPVKRGKINLLTVDPKGTSATGDIIDGVIKNVTSKKLGDGAKVGNYRVTIIAFDEAYLEDARKRTALGPDPKDIAVLAQKVFGKNPIPVRYGNDKTSGLHAQIKVEGTDLRFDLTDE